MDNQDNDFDEIEDAAANRRKQQDFDDLQNELSGNEVGRVGRFLSPEARDKLIAQKQGKPSKAMSALEMALMSNPGYAVLHKTAVDETRAAQIVAQEFQGDVEIAFSKVNAAIERMLDEAVTLPDGRKAFMGKTGQAWTVDGEPVDEAIAAGINWDGTPLHEDYQDLLSRRDKVKNVAHRGDEISLRLGEIYNELHEDSKPPSPAQLEAYREEVVELTNEMDNLQTSITAEKPAASIDVNLDLINNAALIPDY